MAATFDRMMEAPAPENHDKLQTEIGSEDGADHSELFIQFESLGQSCEFGLVQRHFKIEPLGLIRFSGIYPQRLLEALQARFEGVGDPEHTTLTVQEREYWTGDKRFGLNSHTFVNPNSISMEAFFPKQCKRLRFLRDKLIRDLTDANKIFVFLGYTDPNAGMARELHAAIRSYGAGQLLFVRANIDGVSAGHVEKVEEGLMFGYLDRYGHVGSDGWNIAYDCWLTVCRKAHDLAFACSA
jgi:hypothetical protein